MKKHPKNIERKEMNKERLTKYLSNYSLEEVMEMVAQSHQIAKERKAVPQEELDALAKRVKNLINTNAICFPVEIKGQLKVNPDWFGVDEFSTKALEFTPTGETPDWALELFDFADINPEKFDNRSLNLLIKQAENVSNSIKEIAQKYHRDEYDLAQELLRLAGHERTHRRARRRMRKSIH